jgi:hypothetical protein
MMEHYDCIVVGSGVCGATAAALVAGAGHKTLLLDSRFPQPKAPDESLLPAAHGTLERLGLLDSLRRQGFPRNTGLALFDHRGERLESLPFASAERAESPTGWHLSTGSLVRLLQEAAGNRGVEHVSGAQFVDAVGQGAGRTLVRCLPAVGRLRTVSCRVLLETEEQPSPAANFPAHRFTLASPLPARWAVWGNYRQAQQSRTGEGQPRLVVQTRPRTAWFWFAPLGNDLTSVGVVGLGNSPIGEKTSVADVFEEQLVQCPYIAERLIQAQLVGSLRSNSQLAAQVSPLFSFGLQGALLAAERRADAAMSVLAGNSPTAAILGDCLALGEQEATRAPRFVAAFMRPDFCLARFLRETPQHQSALASLLAGSLGDESLEPLLTDLAAIPSATIARAAQLS